MNEIVTAFYAAVADADVLFVQAKAASIRALHKRVVEDVVELGAMLNEVKDRLGHGSFGDWIEAEFSWSIRTAQNYMQIAERIEPNAQRVSYLPIRAVTRLVSLPEPSRERLLDRIEAERPTADEVHLLVDEDRQAAKQTAKSVYVREKRSKKKLSPEEKEKAADQFRRKLENQRRESDERAARQEAASFRAAEMIRDRFGDDLPQLLEALNGAHLWTVHRLLGDEA